MSELRVVHLDEHLAVVDKPAGLVVHPAPSHQGPTLVDELAEILGGGADPERPGIVHRLDKGTSGLLVVARDDTTHAALQEQVRRREVERVYLALAGGRLGSRTGTIDAPIGRASRQRHRMAVSGAASRQARTHFEVLELLAVESYLEAKLETGRTHQIRAHFAAISHPVAGRRDTASIASSCTRTGWPSPIQPAGNRWAFARSCPRIWRPHSNPPAQPEPPCPTTIPSF